MRFTLIIGVMVVLLMLQGCATTESQNSSRANNSASSQGASKKELENKKADRRLALAIEYLRQGNYDWAKMNLEKAKEHAPKRADIQYAFGYYYQTVGEYELAEEYFLKSIKIDPNQPEVYNNYGTFLCDRGRFEEAEENFLKAVSIKSYTNAGQAFENLAFCSLKAKKEEEANFYFSKALDHNPRLLKTLTHLVNQSILKEDYKSAREYMRDYERATPHSPGSLFAAWTIEVKLDNQRGAATYEEMLMSRFPDSPQAQQLQQIKNQLR
ncbi:MAG: type IV pilus biogenesis/stability protein PilW [Kangiellaceae bacterium]|nr:type IV pilus biogenesis/stability protein PilW [Kangiellaceae bacterium]|tara:strand:- start:11925 stop:12731 length:807 start_codon:yes stop_codon:yes gene_type:complete